MIEDGIIYKVCALCKQKKVRGNFDKHNSYPDGFNARCKQCARVKNNSGKYRDIKFAKAQRMRYGHAKL